MFKLFDVAVFYFVIHFQKLQIRGGSLTGGVERRPRSHKTLSFCISVCTVASGAPRRFCSVCAQGGASRGG